MPKLKLKFKLPKEEAEDEHDQEICQDVPRLYRFLVQSEYVKNLAP